MFLVVWLLLFGGAWSGSAAIAISEDIEGKIRSGFYFPSIVNHVANGGEDRWLKQYFGKQYMITWIEDENEAFKFYKQFMDKGLTLKGLTFNVYDDTMREEAIALFRLFQTMNIETFHMTTAWASIYVNDGILEYALRLAVLYTKALQSIDIPPPFLVKPNYFFNSETLRKAGQLKLKNGVFIGKDAKVNQYYRTNDTITINTNYSGWNLLGNGCLEKLAYFREDIGLNSFYYSIHLLHPFWMSNDEMDKLNPRQAEHYYYAHQQLLARYNLEIDSNDLCSCKPDPEICDFPSYNPYLEYRNGLSFPVRHPFNPILDLDAAGYLSSVDTAINEYAARGLTILMNGTRLNLTEDNLEVLAKLIRANVDGVKYAKIVRSLYGAQGYPIDKYNPAPSVIHHPETSLRDPMYWNLLTRVMDYFNKFKKSTSPRNLTEYESSTLEITQKQPLIIVTYFEYYQSDIGNALSERFDNVNQRSMVFTARQKRLAHYPFNIELNIISMEKKSVTIRLFLGPRCEKEKCFGDNIWFELDTFKVNCSEGGNLIKWSPETSKKYSNDDRHNFEHSKRKIDKKSRYNMFKFSQRLVVPKGKKNGYNATLFIMVTENITVKTIDNELSEEKVLYNSVHYEDDQKPLGFPFDRSCINYNSEAKNYKFVDATIFHNTDESKTKASGYFSPELD